MDKLSKYLNQFSKKLDIEIDFYKEQIINNLDCVSAYRRYVKLNESYINENPKEEAEFYKHANKEYHSYFPYMINNALLITFDSYFDNKFF